MYQHGRGVTPNFSEAVIWCRLAAKQGYADAQNTLGWRYQYAKGVIQNYEEAIQWYRKAALNRDMPMLRLILGSCLRGGIKCEMCNNQDLWQLVIKSVNY